MQGAIQSGVVLDLGDLDLEVSAEEARAFKEEREKDTSKLVERLVDKEKVEAADVIDAIFPRKEADVFISHSFKDVNKARKLAKELSKKGLNCFIDSSVWGSSKELLGEIDRIYCYKKKSGTYDYDKRNASTAHVHMMLATALQNMIYSSKYFLFLKSDHSIDLTNIESSDEDKTLSPWVHMELNFSSMVMPKKIKKSFEASTEDSARNLIVRHDAYTDHLRKREKHHFSLLLFDMWTVEYFFEGA